MSDLDGERDDTESSLEEFRLGVTEDEIRSYFTGFSGVSLILWTLLFSLYLLLFSGFGLSRFIFLTFLPFVNFYIN